MVDDDDPTDWGAAALATSAIVTAVFQHLERSGRPMPPDQIIQVYGVALQDLEMQQARAERDNPALAEMVEKARAIIEPQLPPARKHLTH
ncbi:MAG: hypothetical protein ACOH2M_26540 [Cypionkella sp.]